MILDENWAVSIDRVRFFFAQQPDITPDADAFLFGACRISLTACEGSLGAFPLQRTRLHIEGPEDEVKSIYHRFFMRFLSAGG